MPKFPGLSGADIVRALEKCGFVVARQSGSHIVMKRGKQGFVVPNHKEVKIGEIGVRFQLIQQWMGADSAALLNGKFETLPVFTS